ALGQAILAHLHHRLQVMAEPAQIAFLFPLQCFTHFQPFTRTNRAAWEAARRRLPKSRFVWPATAATNTRMDAIEVRGLDFAYPSGAQVLRGLDLSVPS